MSKEFDVLVIGAGAGGGFAALGLCEAGLKVGLLDRGPVFNPEIDYALNYTDWDSRPDPLMKAREREQTIDLSYRHSKSRRGSLIYHRVHGVGGSTLHYQGEAHRFPEHAFKLKSLFGWGEDWPLQYQVLAEYYSRAETLLGVAGEAGNPFKASRGTFPCPAHTLTDRSKVLQKSAADAGMQLLPNTLALPSKSVGGRLPCQHSGGCNLGCIFKAKSSVDQAIVPKALATGNLELLSDTRALRITTDNSGEITAVECIQNGEPISLTAKRYVLAGGALETPRLLLHSKSAQWPDGFGNRHDQVGRYFMETVLARLPLVLESSIKTHRGPPLDSRIWDFAYPKDQQTSGFVLGSAGYLHRGTGPQRHAVSTPGIGKAHKQKVRESFGTNLYLFGIAEQEPVANNRLQLSDKTDERDIPKLKIECEYSARDINTIEQMSSQLEKWAAQTPTKNIGAVSTTRFQSSATHVGGACRMGNNAEQSVVDSFGKIHGQQNAYIADASVFVSQGAGDSPSLTIHALALRTADAIVRDLKT